MLIGHRQDVFQPFNPGEARGRKEVTSHVRDLSQGNFFFLPESKRRSGAFRLPI